MNLLHRLTEVLLPWYDPRLERARGRRSEAIRSEAVQTRGDVERVLRTSDARKNRILAEYDAADDRARWRAPRS